MTNFLACGGRMLLWQPTVDSPACGGHQETNRCNLPVIRKGPSLLPPSTGRIGTMFLVVIMQSSQRCQIQVGCLASRCLTSNGDKCLEGVEIDISLSNAHAVAKLSPQQPRSEQSFWQHRMKLYRCPSLREAIRLDTWKCCTEKFVELSMRQPVDCAEREET